MRMKTDNLFPDIEPKATGEVTWGADDVLSAGRSLQGAMLDKLRAAGLPVAWSLVEGIAAEPEDELWRRIMNAVRRVGAKRFIAEQSPGDRKITFRWR